MNENVEQNLNEIKINIQPIIKNAIDEFVSKYLPKEYIEGHTLKMDIEKIYKSLLLVDVKKRYIGKLKYYDGKEINEIHYMGLDLKKSNTIEICKKAQFAIAEAILNNEKIKETMDKYYKLIIENDDINWFKIPSKLEKPQDAYLTITPAVKASLWSNINLKTKFRVGNKFYILYVKKLNNPVLNYKNKIIKIESIAFDSEDQLTELKYEIDKEKYITDLYNKINNLVRGIADLNKMNEECYLKYIKKQNTLSEYINDD
jgi:DNA polymerase elongation subunit (family B)